MEIELKTKKLNLKDMGWYICCYRLNMVYDFSVGENLEKIKAGSHEEI